MKEPVPSSPASREQPRELSSLASIVGALLTCAHPEGCRFSARIHVTEQPVRVTWCGACGSLHSDEVPADESAWQPIALLSLLSKSHLEELSRLLHAIGRWHAAAEATGEVPPKLAQEIAQFARGLIVRDADRLDDAIEQLFASG